MSENEDHYHDTVLNLEEKVKKNVDMVLKIGNSVQGMFMLGPKPMSFYDSKLKHGLGDTEDTLEDATKSQIKMKNKMQDPIAIEKKQNVCTIDYTRMSATSRVRRSSNRDSSIKDNVVSNTKNSAKKVEVSDRTNQKPDVASKNIALNRFGKMMRQKTLL
ncbi:hypothetical protein Tco_0881275 [Tanacetum coccineum]